MDINEVEPMLGAEEPVELVDEDEDEKNKREMASEQTASLEGGIGAVEPEVGSIPA